MTSAGSVRLRGIVRFVSPGLMCLVGCWSGSTSGPADSRPSAVVLITVDTLRADSVSWLGDDPRTTPFLEHLSADGVVFTNAYAPSSWTVPSMASLFTGVAPSSHGVITGEIGGVVRQGGPERVVVAQPLLPGSFTTLAEAFQQAGFETVGIPSNTHLADYLGFGQGFRHYYGKADFLSADQVNLTVEEYLRRAFGPGWKKAWKEHPTFLWIHYFDPHDPHFVREPWLSKYSPELSRNPGSSPANLVMKELLARHPHPDQALAEKIRPLYRAEISYMDEHLRLLNAELGLEDDNVLFILTADHGEEIVDHGGLGHGHSLYDELVHVPLMIRWPARVKGGRRIESPVSLLDVYPTLAELNGFDAPEELQGRSLARLLRGGGEEESRTLCFELDRPGVKAAAILRHPCKLVQQTFPESRLQLFDLVKDPGEQCDLARLRPRDVVELEALLLRQLESLRAPPGDLEHVGIEDEKLLKQLQAFGYIGENAAEPK